MMRTLTALMAAAVLLQCLSAPCLPPRKEEPTWSWKLEKEIEIPGRVGHLVFSPRGKYLGIAQFGRIDDDRAILWDVRRHEPYREFPGHVCRIAFSASEKMLATTTIGKSIVFWELASGKQRMTIQHETRLGDIRFSNNGRYLAGADSAKNILIWKLVSGGKPAVLARDCQKRHIESLSFSPDGQRLVSCSGEEQMALWDVAKCQAIVAPKDEGGSNAAVFSPDGQCIACGQNPKTEWDMEKQCSVSRRGHPDNPRLNFFDARTGRLLSSHEEETEVHPLAFSADSRFLAYDNSRTVCIWNIREKKKVFTHENGRVIECIAVGPAFDRIAVVPKPVERYGEHVVQIYRLKAGR